MTHKGTAPLETERLILRQFSFDDAEAIFRNCWSNYDVWKWTNYKPMKTMDDLFNINNIFTEFWFAKYDNPAYYNWVIVSKETNEAIGRIWVMNTDEKIKQAELAYELGVNWWNQGLMTEAVKAWCPDRN
jgi:ribosomal-protein-alanine N-acetyltransferase